MADKSSSKRTQYFAAIAAAVGAMAFGTGVAWRAATGPNLIENNDYRFQITHEQLSWAQSAMILGAGAGCILAGYLINIIGLGEFVSAVQLSVICLSIPFIFGVLVLLCPESPTYLVQNNRHDDASRALLWLRGKRYDPSIELTEMQMAIQKQRQTSKSVAALMLRSSSVKALGIIFGLFICQQLCYVYAFVFYARLLRNADAQLSPALILSIAEVIVAFVSVVVVDRLGRRILLLTSQFVVTIWTLSTGYGSYANDTKNWGAMSWLPVAPLFLLVIAFPLGLGPVPWVMLGELFAPDVKGLAASISVTLRWMLVFICSSSAQTIYNFSLTIGVVATFSLFSAISVVGIVFIYFAVPETKDKSLYSIQQMLDKSENEEVDSSGCVDQP